MLHEQSTPELKAKVNQATCEEEFPEVSLLSLAQVNEVPEVAAMQRVIKLWDRSKKKHARQYTRLRAHFMSMGLKERASIIESIMSMTEFDSMSYHPPNDENQLAINSVILDQRYTEGLKIQRLKEAIEKTRIDDIPPHEVVGFIHVRTNERANE